MELIYISLKAYDLNWRVQMLMKIEIKETLPGKDEKFCPH